LCEHPVNFVREQAYEGKYLIETEEPIVSATGGVRVYKELSEVERAFANFKDIMEMRPLQHRTAERVEGHAASLALLIHRDIEKKLKVGGPRPLATEAMAALKSPRVRDIARADGVTKQCVTHPTPRDVPTARARAL
jgi:transposase